MNLETAKRARDEQLPVRKVSGYHFTGYIVSIFGTRAGNVRIVVESADHIGLLHIFNLDQFEVM